ncbi:Uncharacterised protein [Mycobacteroides abscessus subsp. abscessus]|nr:Uncharacterised protein [Mycobacteroides abscessus subsp. abscessus]
MTARNSSRFERWTSSREMTSPVPCASRSSSTFIRWCRKSGCRALVVSVRVVSPPAPAGRVMPTTLDFVVSWASCASSASGSLAPVSLPTNPGEACSRTVSHCRDSATSSKMLSSTVLPTPR